MAIHRPWISPMRSRLHRLGYSERPPIRRRFPPHEIRQSQPLAQSAVGYFTSICHFENPSSDAALLRPLVCCWRSCRHHDVSLRPAAPPGRWASAPHHAAQQLAPEPREGPGRRGSPRPQSVGESPQAAPLRLAAPEASGHAPTGQMQPQLEEDGAAAQGRQRGEPRGPQPAALRCPKPRVSRGTSQQGQVRSARRPKKALLSSLPFSL
eukprot:scaffold1637_cov253-Pinguiococcus_pyrenoidosus.AAC.9